MRRTRLPEGAQRELWPNWRHHAFTTNRADLDTEAADARHRAHARVELAIRDLKDNGLAHCLSGNFFANAALLACAAFAHNLTRWCARPDTPPTPTASPSPPACADGCSPCPDASSTTQAATDSRMPAHWPWATNFTTALAHIRNLPLLI